MSNGQKAKGSYKKHRKCHPKQEVKALQWFLEQLLFPKLGFKPTSWSSAKGNSRKQFSLTEGKHIANSWLVTTCLFSRKGLLLPLSSEHAGYQKSQLPAPHHMPTPAHFGTYPAVCLLASGGSSVVFILVFFPKLDCMPLAYPQSRFWPLS